MRNCLDLESHEFKKQALLFEHLFNASTDVLVFLDINKTVITCNNALMDNFGIKKDDLVGKNFKWLFEKKISKEHSPDRVNYLWGRIERGIDNVLSTTKPYRYSEKFYLEGNKIQYFNILISSVLSEENKVCGFIITGRNITNEMQLTISLEEKTELLECILERIPIGAFLKDRYSDYIIGSLALKNNVSFFNTKDAKHFSVRDLFASDYLELVKSEDEEIYRNKKSIQVERLVKFTNNSCWCRVYKTPLFDKNGEVKAIIIMYENISLEKQCETERKFFIKTLIHDLKVPTIAQLRGIQLLKNEVVGNVTTEQRELLNEIEDSCDYVLDMISTILNGYRLDNGEYSLNLEEVFVNNFINNCIDDISQKYNLPVKINYNEVSDSMLIVADSHYLQKIVVILLIKIMTKYNPPECINIKVEKKRDFVKFLISLTDKSTIGTKENWIPFKDLLKNLKFITVGYGVDLYLCNKVIDLHNGNAFVDVEDTNIKQFSFEIPANRQN